MNNTSSTCPLASLIPGSEWNLLSSGYSLWTTTGNRAGDILSASLPNIKGTVTDADRWYNQVTGTGAFKQVADSSTPNGGYTGVDPLSRTKSVVDFDASRSNSVYSASAGANVVRPNSYTVKIFKRTA